MRHRPGQRPQLRGPTAAQTTPLPQPPRLRTPEIPARARAISVQRGNFGPFVQHATRNRGNSGVLARTRLGPVSHRHQGKPPPELGHQNCPWRASQAEVSCRPSVGRARSEALRLDRRRHRLLPGRRRDSQRVGRRSLHASSSHLTATPAGSPDSSMPSRSSCATTAPAHRSVRQAPRSLRRVPHPEPLP